jgi:hypothetical protein
MDIVITYTFTDYGGINTRSRQAPRFPRKKWEVKFLKMTIRSSPVFMISLPQLNLIVTNTSDSSYGGPMYLDHFQMEVAPKP